MGAPEVPNQHKNDAKTVGLGLKPSQISPKYFHQAALVAGPNYNAGPVLQP